MIGKPTVAAVVETAVALFGVDVDELLDSRRVIPSRYRMAIYIAAREVTGRSVNEIADACGRDHTTVRHAFRRAGEQERFWAGVIAEETVARWAARDGEVVG